MNRDPLQLTHYQGLRKGGRSLALVAKLVQLGFMGLGLSICREIVEAHHGRLTTAPGSSRGTVFVMTLPIASRQEPDDVR